MEESITHIPLNVIHESPSNPRKTFSEAGLHELASSIESQGVMQPIVVRPRMPSGLQAEHWDPIEHGYEIVFGHRRFRASALAGRERIPCIVRSVSDIDVALQQIHENLEREDVNPIEEGEGFNVLKRQHNVSMEELIKQTGKSKSYIFASIRLSLASTVVRNAVLDKTIGREIGVLLASVPMAMQNKALLDVTYLGDDDKRVAMSYREAAARVRNGYTFKLAEAPFDLHDFGLLQGVGDCMACEKNSNNAPHLNLGSNICSDVDCSQRKCDAHFAQFLSAARANGQDVIEGEDAKMIMASQWSRPKGYCALSFEAWNDGTRWVTVREAMERAGKKAPKATVIVNPYKADDVREYLRDEQVEELVAQYGPPPDVDDDEDGSTPGSAARARSGGGGYVDHRSPEQRLLDTGSTRNRVKAAICARVMASPRTIEELRGLVIKEIEAYDGFHRDVEDMFGWTKTLDEADDEEQARLQLIRDMSADQLGQLLVINLVWNGGFTGAPTAAEDLIATAALYGVDVAAIAGEEEQEQKDDAGVAGGSADQADLLAEA